MRRKPSDAERKIWYVLRDRRLEGFKFRRQVPIGGYIADFVCEEASLIVELDGDQHADPLAVEYDQVRTLVLQERRYRVIRFSSREAVKYSQAVARTILRVLKQGH